MVEALTFTVAQRIFFQVLRQELIRRIRFDEESVKWHRTKCFPLFKFALLRKVARKRKVCAEFRQHRDHFFRTAEGMQDKTASRTRVGLEEFKQTAPGFQTMDADREIALGCELQLPKEDFFLLRRIIVFDPAVEPDLTNGSRHLIDQCC